MKQNIVVTGAGGGIGYAMVSQLLQNGYNVIAVTRSKAKFKQLNSSFKNQLSVWEIDFLSEDYVEKLTQYLKKTDRIDILINNAGLLINKSFESTSKEEIHQLVTVNYTGALELTRQCLPFIKRSNSGHVVNISTMGAVQGSAKFPGLSIYASTKAAICTFTEVMAEEYKKEGIHFNCLAIGSVETAMFNDAFPGHKASQSVESMAAYITDFALYKRSLFNGKIITVASDTP